MPSPRYRKTAAGQSEVGSKAHHLPPRARSLLIMVDGKRSLDELRGMLGPAVDEAVALLVREGLVEALAAAPETGSAPPPMASAAPAPAPASVNLVALRRDAAHAVTDALGPMADAVALRLEKAKDLGQLRAALHLAHDAIANVSHAKAQDFQTRFVDPLPPAP